MKMAFVFGLLLTSTTTFASGKVCFGIADRKGERLLLQVTEQTLEIQVETGIGNASSGAFSATGHIVHSQSGIDFLQYNGGKFSECGTLFYLIDEALLADGGTGKLKVVCRSNTEAYFCRDAR